MKALLALIAVAPSIALAEGGQPAMAMDGAIGWIYLIGFAAIFYFLLWRPQSKRQKEHKNLVENLAKNDEVVTAGGMLGKVVKVTEEFAVIEVADGVQFPVQKVAVTAVLPKGTIKEVKA
ncbi:MAG: preprotein translocase subunit YajC [Thalassolituus sp.]